MLQYRIFVRMSSIFLFLLLGGQEEMCPTTDLDGDGIAVEIGDCDDTDDTVYPGAPELCDGKDNDCDGVADEGVGFFRDADGDEYGVNTLTTCTETAGYVRLNGDCNDADQSIHPNISDDTCDNVDNDCDGQVDEEAWFFTVYRDDDGDEYGTEESLYMCGEVSEGYAWSSWDCDDTDPSIHPGAPELCDGIDNNCNEGKDGDADGDG
ncbi:MAG TPA: putative metal-binding motif-containing protein, partial [Patescibacteria group bacterium]|nr:putative metal-binding motif-containing protein [Patescibacteria group bacterium]